MTDREERQHVIEVLKSWDGYFIGYTSDEVQEALRYAIASIETDLKYDLLYEETSGQADKQADKPITKNCESCRYYGSHHKVCNYCYKCSLWTEQELTNKNDLAHNLCGTCINYKCEFQSDIVRTKCAFYMPPTESNCSEISTDSIIDWNNCHTSEQLDSISTAKNNLAVDCIDRKKLIDWINIWDITPIIKNPLIRHIQGMSSVTPQEPKTGHWIANAPQYDMLNPQYICSECGNAHTRTTPYCEMCGAKMVEPQESEEV